MSTVKANKVRNVDATVDNLSLDSSGNVSVYGVGDLSTALAAKLTTPSAWTSYTPTLTATTTNPTLGTGATAVGKYAQMGKVVIASFRIVFGNSPSAGSGSYLISLPVTGTGPAPFSSVGVVRLFDSSAGTGAVANAVFNNSDGTKVLLTATSTVTSASPWTWTTTDELSGTFTYEAA